VEDQSVPIPEELISEIGRIIDSGKWSLEALSVMETRMLRNQLSREGVMVGRKHLRTLMARMGMEALYRKPSTSKKHPGHEMYPYLLRGLTINRANQVWALVRPTSQWPKGSSLAPPSWIGSAGRS
jgi:hypothetical protein